jgi:rhodanese-related sulfurtransferase
MTMSTTNTVINAMSKEELAERIKNAEPIQIINVLETKYYKLGFIKGSKKIPLDQLNDRLGEIDIAQKVVTYCASYDCTDSHRAAESLAAQGFMVSVYEGGIKEWRLAGLPID